MLVGEFPGWCELFVCVELPYVDVLVEGLQSLLLDQSHAVGQDEALVQEMVPMATGQATVNRGYIEWLSLNIFVPTSTT